MVGHIYHLLDICFIINKTPVTIKFLLYVSVMRSDVQTIFMQSPCTKQVLMFSATLSKELKTVCRRFMSDVNIFIFAICLVFYFNVHEIRLEATTVLCCSASMILHKETFTEVL